jgi:GT2 family glycosyltransferase
MRLRFPRLSQRADRALRAKQQPLVNGFYRCRENNVSGWIIDLKNPQHKHDVEVFVGGKSIGRARADRFDPLVQSHHGGDGKYAFALYYNGEFNGDAIESHVTDCETGTPLNSKLRLVTASPRRGEPLAVDSIRVGRGVELFGRVGAYPWVDATLELWFEGERVVSSIPVTGSQTEGTFSARIEGEALRYLLGGGVEVALPGLKEAGLAVPIPKPPVNVVVWPENRDSLRVELRGNFQQTGLIEGAMRFITAERVVEEPVSFASRATNIRVPAGIDLSECAFELAISRVAIAARIEWPLLNDLQFRELTADSTHWSSSANAVAESGFFAFAEGFADEHELSGHTAHVIRTEGDAPLRLFQVIRDAPPGQREVSVTAFARAQGEAQLIARLRDDDGVLSERSISSRSSRTWHRLHLTLKPERPIAGKLVFEAEAAGPNVTSFDVTLGSSRQLRETGSGGASSNLLVNQGFREWPHGAGMLEHSQAGQPCGGWHLINRHCSDFVFTRAITHPVDGTLGLALAAPQITHYLRLEVDVAATKLSGRPLRLRFRAGIPASAKQLLSHQADAVPQFTIIDPIQLRRRLRITKSDSFEEREEIVAVFARKLAVSRQIERFDFCLPSIEEAPAEDSPETIDVQESFYVAFEFRHPAVIALFDVELVAEEIEERDQTRPLNVEDRNVALQLETLQTVSHWRQPTPVRLESGKRKAAPAPLKWLGGPTRDPVTIVIPVFNALSDTLACLDSLNGSTSVPILVSVIDDASDTPVREAIVEYASDKPWVRIQSFSQNRGYTYAADYGIRDAATEWVVLLNSDTIVTRGWLEGMLACSRSDPAIAFVGPVSNAASYQSVPQLYDASRKWKVNRLPPGITPEDIAGIVHRVSHREYPEVPLLNGFCTLMKRDVFLELGGLNATAFPSGYGEENDLCLRATKAGAKLAVADDVYVHHVKSASFGDARRKDLTKDGNRALQKLHPDVDIAALTASFRETPALVALRRSIAVEIEKLHGARPDGMEPPPDLAEVDGSTDPEGQLQKA